MYIHIDIHMWYINLSKIYFEGVSVTTVILAPGACGRWGPSSSSWHQKGGIGGIWRRIPNGLILWAGIANGDGRVARNRSRDLWRQSEALGGLGVAWGGPGRALGGSGGALGQPWEAQYIPTNSRSAALSGRYIIHTLGHTGPSLGLGPGPGPKIWCNTCIWVVWYIIYVYMYVCTHVCM